MPDVLWSRTRQDTFARSPRAHSPHDRDSPGLLLASDFLGLRPAFLIDPAAIERAEGGDDERRRLGIPPRGTAPCKRP